MKNDLKDLEIQLAEAKKGKAKVDKEYVKYDGQNHLFEYKIDFPQFMDDIMHIIKSK